MNRELRRLVDAGDGVARRATLLGTVPRDILDHAIRAGQLVRIQPGVYTDPARLADPRVHALAGLAYAGPDAALSHLTALGVWRLPGGDLDGPVHVLVPWSRRLRAGRRLVVHRRRGFVAEAPEVVSRGGVPTSCLERCVVDSWSLLPSDTRRAAVIGAVGDRRTTPDRLRSAIGDNLNIPGRKDLLRLVNLLDRGCRSELELWGYDGIFSGPGMPAVEWNHPIRIGDRTIYLDAYCRSARVDFELDGIKYHSSPADRERNARRDAALAALGIMVVRFTHDRLTSHPRQVRAEIQAIVAARVRGLAG